MWPKAAARLRLRAAAAVAAIVVFVVLWQFFLAQLTLAPTLISLGLDQDRTQLSVALSAAFVAALAGAALGRPWIAWPAGAVWFVATYLVPTLATGLPAPAPGEQVDPTGLAVAMAGLVGMAAGAAGLGAAGGVGVRNGFGVAHSAVRERRWPALSRVAGAIALLVVAAIGLSQAPTMLLYGAWGAIYQATPLVRTRQVTLSFHSKILGNEQTAVVILPSGYDSNPHLRYPVLYLLHGSPGRAEDWPSQGAGDIVAAVAHDGLAPPMIIVSPSGNGVHGGARDYWADDYVPGDLAESSFLHELMPEVDSHFRVAADRSHQVIGGLSSGGYGAANIALRHPDVFALAIDLSGDLRPPADAFGGDEAKRVANDPLLLAAQPKPADASAFYVAWGASDPFASVNEQFATQLKASHYLMITSTANAGHEWSAWRSLLADSLTKAGYLVAPPA